MSEVVYQATVKTQDAQDTYIGLTSNQSKTRYRNHQMSFRHVKRRNETELWKLKDDNKEFTSRGRLSHKQSHTITSVTISRILQPYNIRVAHKPATTLRHLLTNVQQTGSSFILQDQMLRLPGFLDLPTSVRLAET